MDEKEPKNPPDDIPSKNTSHGSTEYYMQDSKETCELESFQTTGIQDKSFVNQNQEMAIGGAKQIKKPASNERTGRYSSKEKRKTSLNKNNQSRNSNNFESSQNENSENGKPHEEGDKSETKPSSEDLNKHQSPLTSKNKTPERDSILLLLLQIPLNKEENITPVEGLSCKLATRRVSFLYLLWLAKNKSRAGSAPSARGLCSPPVEEASPEASSLK